MTSKQSTAGRSRRWIIPPASARPARQFIRGTEILTELTGSFRVLLWLLYRDLELCVTVAPERRTGLFRLSGLRAFEKVPLPEPIAAHVRVMCEMLADIRPARAAECCRAIASWARPHAPRTALLFAETAARSQPESASLTRDVGIHALACGLAPQGVAWLKRAIALGRRTGDWMTYAQVFADLAEYAEGTDDFARAQRHYSRAMLVFRRKSLGREVRARAATGLLRAALRNGDPVAADRLARLAVRSFDSGDSRAAGVRLQVARALMDAKEHARALAVLRERRVDRAHPSEAAMAGLAVRAAAVLDDPDALDAEWDAFVVAAGATGSGHSAEIAETVSAVLSAIRGDHPPRRLRSIRAEAARMQRAPRP
jgi:hypothetical protein